MSGEFEENDKNNPGEIYPNGKDNTPDFRFPERKTIYKVIAEILEGQSGEGYPSQMFEPNPSHAVDKEVCQTDYIHLSDAETARQMAWQPSSDPKVPVSEGRWVTICEPTEGPLANK